MIRFHVIDGVEVGPDTSVKLVNQPARATPKRNTAKRNTPPAPVIQPAVIRATALSEPTGPTKLITARLPVDLVEWLDAAASTYSETRTAALCRVLRTALTKD